MFTFVKQLIPICLDEEERIVYSYLNIPASFILEEKNLPKGAAVKDSYYFYLDLHPGVFKLASEELSKFLCSDQKIKLRAGRPNRYGDATTTSTCYYTFKIGGKDKTLQLRFYPTKNAFDISMTGANDNKAEKHVEFGMKNGALYFVDEVMPRFIEYLYLNFEVEKTKIFWGNLAKTGYEQELKKDGAKGKGNGKGKGKGKGAMNTPAKGKGKCGCGHCQKSIGSKIAIQCEGCKNLNLVECLSNISENKLKDFTLGNDNFICGKCVLTNVDYETLSLEPAANEPAANVLAIDTTVVPPPPVVNEEFIGEINGLKLEIARKDIAYASLKSKCDLLSSSFDQVTKKVEGIEKSVKDSEDIRKTQVYDIQKYKESIEKLEREKVI